MEKLRFMFKGSLITVVLFLILATSCQKEAVDLQVKQSKDLVTNPIIKGFEDGYHELIGPADNSYNCFGLTFKLCETAEGPYIIPDGFTVYDTYIASGMFIEVSEGDTRASKVLYWNNSVDFGRNDLIGAKAIDHASMIVPGGLVISKEGFGSLYKNNISYYYLFPVEPKNNLWRRAYMLNTALSCTNRTPKYGDTFTVKAPAKLEGAVYSWSYPSGLQRIGGNENSNIATFQVISTGYSTGSIKLTVRHQILPIVGTSYIRTLTSSVGITIGTKPPVIPQVSGYITGSPSINVGKTGLYKVVITVGLAPYHIEWFLRKGNDGTGGILVATEETLLLQSVNAAMASYSKQQQGPMRQPIYSTDFYLSARVYDANNTMCITPEFHINAYGNVNLIAITRD